MNDRAEKDPYATPRAPRDRSGAVVRLGILAVLLGAMAWGYTSFSNAPPAPLVATDEQQQIADSAYDTGYEVSPASAPTSAPAVPPAG